LIIEDVSDLPILSDILNEAFVRIRQRQPHIDIRFKSVHGKSLEEALMNGDLDIGFSWYFPSDHIGQNEGGVNHDEYIESVRIMPYDNEMLIMVPRDNPLAAQASLDIKDLTQLEFYRPVNASFEHYFVSFENICAQHGVTLNYRLIVIESLSDLFYLGHSDCAFLISTSMLKAGAVPRSVLDRIAPVPLSDVDLHWNLYAEWHAHSKNPNIPPFIEQLAAVSEAKA
jgi:DNA-binding transcriptional LysR family regulator